MNRFLVVLGLGLGLWVTGFASMAQTPIFKIIAASPKVAVDGKPVQVPLDVHAIDQVITIPEGEYVALITEEGEAFYYFRTFKAIDMVDARRFSQKMNEAPATPHVPKLIFLGYEYRGPYLFGDTLFLPWTHPANKKSKYNVSITDMYDDVLETLAVDQTDEWVIHPVGELLKKHERVVVYVNAMDDNMRMNNSIVVRRMKDSTKLANDLQHYSSTKPDHLLIRAALFEINDCYFDQFFELYKNIKSKYVPSDPILKVYLEQRVKGHSLDRGAFKIN